MDQNRQKHLAGWLKAHRTHGKRWLNLSVMLGTLSAVIVIVQAGLIAHILQQTIIDKYPLADQFWLAGSLAGCFITRALLFYFREKAGFCAGQAIRLTLRRQLMQRLDQLGPAWVATKPAGSWATLLHEQIENMQDYYARYLPQISLAAIVPLLIFITLLPVNWAAAAILLATAPLIPLFMAMVGMGAADANRRNFAALARLGGDFLDRLRGLDTLRLFGRGQAEQLAIADTSEQFRLRTMDVLRIAFLSSAVLEFFASVSIALVAIYFGFAYLGLFHFGRYSTPVTLFAGFLCLMLAPEFYQPLRDLGTFYHAKAQALGAADELEAFLHETGGRLPATQPAEVNVEVPLTIVATDLVAVTPHGHPLAGPFTFTFTAGQRIAIVGPSGAGKSSLINVLLGLTPYQGSLNINGHQLSALDMAQWQSMINWVGQNPRLFAGSLLENITGGQPIDDSQLASVLENSGVSEFIHRLPGGLASEISDQSAGLSVGQAQRVAVARALARHRQLLVLDEPTASLDRQYEAQVMQALTTASYQQSTLLITHQLDRLDGWDEIWVINRGKCVQQGDFARLSQSSGLFREMWLHRQGDIE